MRLLELSPNSHMTAPDIRISAGALTGAGAGAVVVGLLAPADGDDFARLGSGGRAFAKQLGLDADSFIATEKAKGTAGQVLTLPVTGHGELRAVILIGLGSANDKTATAASRTRAALKAGAALARAGATYGSLASPVIDDFSTDLLRSFVEAVGMAAYAPDPKATSPDGKASKEPKKALERLTLVTRRATDAQAAAVAKGIVTSNAVRTARDLINQPSLVKTPDWLAKRAKAIVASPRVEVTTYAEAELKARGFGGILAVGQGSTRPPRLVQLDYTPEGTATGHVVLVGKGITFDSGGLSIKPNDGMVAMKTDMAGSAAVIATISLLTELGCRARVTGLIALAENMPSGTAMRPGDVVHHFGGTTVEVLNTDAEGRLVLADALAYATMTWTPDAVIDIATLTGAMPVALGKKTAGLFANDDRLATRLSEASVAAGERMWRMPLTDDYLDSLASPVADMTNISRSVSYQGGSIVAALFLQEFTNGRPWAHLDIAGTGRSDGDDDEITKGGTGYGIRTLSRMLERW